MVDTPPVDTISPDLESTKPQLISDTEKHNTPKIIPPESNGDTAKETPSLFRKKKEPQNKSPVLKEKQEVAFDQSQLEESWKAFGIERRKTKIGEMERLVLNRPISKDEGSAVSIQLKSDLEGGFVDKFELELTTFLRRNLKNDSIKLSKKFDEQQKETKVYTNSDKFEALAKQNPKLRELMDRLGLDFEF